MEKWSGYQEYIQEDAIKKEESYKDILVMYSCICTLTGETKYFLVLFDNILLESSEPLYNEFSQIEEVCEIFEDDFEDKIELYKNKIYKEIDGVIVKDTYLRGKNAGLRKAMAILKDMNN